MKKNWWKILAIVLVMYSVIWGLLGDVPRLPILNETIRNLYFHVTMWFAMMFLMTASLVYSIMYLSGFKLKNDLIASELTNTGILMGTIGIATGSLWAQFTWGDWWVNDVKLNGAAITMLVYLAYLVLRNSLDDEHKKAKVAAVYNIFAFVQLIIFLGILPRMTDSLHPGNGGNPGFSNIDITSSLAWVFRPAVIGWFLLGVWITTLRIRLKKVENKLEESSYE